MTQTLTERATELIEREFEGDAPNTNNCVEHKDIILTERPIDCPMCATDMREMVKAALKANEWLCRWQDDAKRSLRDLREKVKQQSIELSKLRTTESPVVPAPEVAVTTSEPEPDPDPLTEFLEAVTQIEPITPFENALVDAALVTLNRGLTP